MPEDVRRDLADILGGDAVASVQAGVRLGRAQQVDDRAGARTELDVRQRPRLPCERDEVARDLLRDERRVELVSCAIQAHHPEQRSDLAEHVRGDALVRKVCGHLGTVRHRSAAVEYRVEQHAATLGDRVAAPQEAAS